MSKPPADGPDDSSRNASTATSETTEATTATSTYKVLGEFADGTGAGVLGKNTATSGTPIGVEGTTPNASSGYGLYTPDDAKVAGTLEASVLDTAGGDFTVEAGTTATGPAGNVVAGHASNAVDSGVGGATIAGGGFDDGTTDHSNEVLDDYGTVSGGRSNTAGSNDADTTSARDATVGGGQFNRAEGSTATVSGGYNNFASGNGSTVGGGNVNGAGAYESTIGGGSGNDVYDYHGTIAGGQGNQAGSNDGDAGTGQAATVGGGDGNAAKATDATIAGGRSNTVYDESGAIGGGNNNVVGTNDSNATNASNATIAGGTNNKATWKYASVGGGTTNEASGYTSTIGGGAQNTASSKGATVAGGESNRATGVFGAVPGGEYNVAGGQYSLAAGRRAKANHTGSFVWTDSTNADFSSTGIDQVVVRANGGVGVGTNSPTTQFHVSAPGGSSNSTSADHVALIETTQTDHSTQILGLKTNYTGDPSNSTNFLTFFRGDDTTVGALEGNTSGGVVLDSGGSDYAEYMPRIDPDEAIEPADVVGVFGDAVTKDTDGAQRAMVVSDQPVVRGNAPADPDDRDAFETVAFVGQIPVKVRGPVTEGDLVLPSGESDGTARAVAPDEWDPAGSELVVGRAIEADDGDGVTRIRVMVGLDHTSALAGVFERQTAVVDAQRERIDELDHERDRKDERICELESRLAALEDDFATLAASVEVAHERSAPADD